MTLTDALDLAILVWLIGTWFYEGHHRRCSVIAICDKCGARSIETCASKRGSN